MNLTKFQEAWEHYKGVRYLDLSNYITIFADGWKEKSPNIKHPTHTEYIRIDLILKGVVVCTTFLKEIEHIDKMQWIQTPIRFIPHGELVK